MTMIINRTYHSNATFGCRVAVHEDHAPIKMHIGTMIDGWLEPRASIELTCSDALNIIATLQRLVEAVDEHKRDTRERQLLDRKRALARMIADEEIR